MAKPKDQVGLLRIIGDRTASNLNLYRFGADQGICSGRKSLMAKKHIAYPGNERTVGA